MSRSNPTEHTPNPSTRWFEWNGEKGEVRYYDKDAKNNVDVGSDFTFLLLDQLGSVGGWHDPSQSGIYSNEVKDTRQDVMVVKAFKGGTLAEGLYKDIKDRVNAVGGQFVANCYMAFKAGEGFSIGSLKLKGAALGAWMEFCKANRADLYAKAIRIDGFTEGKKGRIVFRVPVFTLKPLSETTNAIAVGLDTQLQTFLDSYLKRTKRDQVESTMAPAHHVTDEEIAASSGPTTITDDDIPF